MKQQGHSFCGKFLFTLRRREIIMEKFIEQSIETGPRAEDFKDIYANQVRLGVTLTDFTIIFGIADDLGSQTINKDLAAIRLSPGTMKLLLVQMSAVLSAYETACGQIPSFAIDQGRETEMMDNVTKSLQEMIGGRTAKTRKVPR